MTPERYRRISTMLDKRQTDLTTIMDGVHKPHNIAAIVRTCDAVGIHQVYSVLPTGRAKVAASAAMGSQRWVKIEHRQDSLEVIHDLQQQGVQVLAAHLSSRAVPYREVDYTRPTALLMGTEKFGVSEASAKAVDQHVVIPMMGMVESFNVSVAAAIILSEACEQRRQAGLYDKPVLDEAERQYLLFKWGYPRIARLCDEKGLDYPKVAEDGQIQAPASFFEALHA